MPSGQCETTIENEVTAAFSQELYRSLAGSTMGRDLDTLTPNGKAVAGR